MPESNRPLPDTRSFGATVTILFSDIRGFTEYTNQYGDEAAYRALQHHNAILRRELERFGGQVVKTQGDSFMVSFTTARGAILCAAAIQRAVGESTPQAAANLTVGVGINTGEPIQEAGDFFGSTVNLASRICAAAGPGQVLVSETTRFVAGRMEGIEYVDRGLHELKGFDEPQRLYEVSWLARDGAAPHPPAVDAGAEDGSSAALDGAVQRALGVLNRVLAIAHRDDPTFRPLLECQARATELRLTLSRATGEPSGFTVQRVDESMLPFADLLALVEGREALDDRRWAQLEHAVSRSFGRELAVAATRGRLVVAGAQAGPVAPRPPERRPPQPVPRPRGTAPPPEPPPRKSAPGPAPPAAAGPPPVDARAAGVPWWTAAHRAWVDWKSSGMAWAHALRAAIARCPYLLAVPVRDSGRAGEAAASGYFLLLEHVENVAPGFLRHAVDRALEAGGTPDAATLGARLYAMLVARGRLAQTFGEFVRDVMIAAIPNPGVWPDARLLENEDATVLVTRPGGPGDISEHHEPVAAGGDRDAERVFAVTVAPLTARFFAVQQGDLPTPREVALRLVAGGAPSDRGWYLTQRTGHVLHSEPRRLAVDGTVLPGLGRDFSAVWLGIFNPDAEQAMAATVHLTTRGEGQPGPRSSAFGRPRG